jgi:L-ascorbate metabolism protein UlaG (beta-lactamase superfamily)
MKQELVYLKPNVVIEPLIDRWYAWSHLISPATAAMNIENRHLKIMNSFIRSPEGHRTAVKNPMLKGGPFMDIDPGRVHDVRSLRDETLGKRKKMLAFSQAVRELTHMLRQEAKGYSLQPLYQRVPDMLKGYVELVYDLNHAPSFRFFEKLLYKSDYYDPDSQSIALWITENDERPFILTTPKLESDDVLHLPISFADPFIDELSRMKRTPKPYEKIRDMVVLQNDSEENLFQSLFTTDRPPPYKTYTGNKARMRYFGHACILIEVNGISILVDPLVSYYGYESSIEHFSDFDLPERIDYVLITHNHQDHILFETLLPLRHRIGQIVVPRTSGGFLQDPSLKLMFEAVGFERVEELGELDTLRMGDCSITGVPFLGEHSDLNIQSKICHHIKMRNFSMLFVADSCNIEPRIYELVHRELGDVDVVFLGMECDGAPLSWLYGPLLSDDMPRDKDQTRRLAGSNYEQGAALVRVFNPKELYVYAMGQEPWLEFISSIKYTPESNPIVASNKLIDECREKGLVSERLFGEKEILYHIN